MTHIPPLAGWPSQTSLVKEPSNSRKKKKKTSARAGASRRGNKKR